MIAGGEQARPHQDRAPPQRAATSADYSNDSRMQWQGSLNHSRNIYMTGTIGAYVDELFYSEEIVDRNLNGRLTMRMGASCEKVTRRTAEPRA